MEPLGDKFRALAEAIERESVLVHRAALIDGYRDIYKFSNLGIDKLIKKATEYGGKKGAKILKERYGVITDRFGRGFGNSNGDRRILKAYRCF
jgi:hypothetical protein